MIRLAGRQDLDAVAQSYTELLRHEQIHGSTTNWVADVYPTRAWAEQCLDDLFVMEDSGEILASVILNHAQAENYREIPWEYPAEPHEVMVTHTLCVPPKQAGRGIGTDMVRFALEYAGQQGCRVMRLDTWVGNEPAKGLYSKLGFRYAGKQKVLHQGLIDEELVYFEKRLK